MQYYVMNTLNKQKPKPMAFSNLSNVILNKSIKFYKKYNKPNSFLVNDNSLLSRKYFSKTH